jgi:hypothetical protein
MFSAVVTLLCSLTLHQMAFKTPLGYVCYHTSQPPALDGKLDSPAWARAPWTEEFSDIEGDAKPRPTFRTRAKMLWDDRNLYIGAELEEPNVWATLTKRDSVIFRDNDFEVFMDPDNDGQFYTELEMNALNTVWDLLLARPYRAGGPALVGWDMHDLKTTVHVNGTLNDPSDVDRGWTLEIAIPWDNVFETARTNFPPHDGDQWRINFSRVEWDVEVVDGKYRKLHRPEHNWVWSPQGVIDMHRPERWGVLQFSTGESGPVPLKPLPGMKERLLLTQIWDAEHEFRSKNHRLATSLAELGLNIEGATLATTPDLFEAAIGEYRIDSNQRFWRVESE